MRRTFGLLAALMGLLLLGASPQAWAEDKIVHDAEFYVLQAQNGKKWAAEDDEIKRKLEALRQKHGRPPNIVYILWDDTAFGAVGFPGPAEELRIHDPQHESSWPAEGINFTRMYTESSCTPTRAAFLTGRIPVRHGMGVVGMPHEFCRPARGGGHHRRGALSEAGYATAFYGKGHLGDIEESYLHNQGFDDALFTPMNQITSLYNPQGNAVNADARPASRRSTRRIPIASTTPGWCRRAGS